MLNSTERFSSRVENYIKYRPKYPAAVVGLLSEECSLTQDSVIADVGSGTGILTKLLLKNGNPVIGVEPNEEMRGAAERLLGGYPRFRSVAATAENTILADKSVEVITAGQAFHWFNAAKARQEFLRILKPHGWVALMWNDRNIADRPFFKEYEKLLLDHGTDYSVVGAKHVDDEKVGEFFYPDTFQKASFPNEQIFDFEGLRGRLLSSSYAPEEGHPKHAPMLDELRKIFDRNQAGGKVSFEYDTMVYYGQLS